MSNKEKEIEIPKIDPNNELPRDLPSFNCKGDVIMNGKKEDANINTFQECSECSNKQIKPESLLLCAGCLSNRNVISFLNRTIKLHESTILRLREERNKRVDSTELGKISERLEEDNYAKEASLVRSLMHNVEDSKEDEQYRKENDRFETLKDKVGEIKVGEMCVITPKGGKGKGTIEIPVIIINGKASDICLDMLKEALIEKHPKILACPEGLTISKIVVTNDV